MNNFFSYNFFNKLLIVLFCLALIPFLILAFYAEPSSDDYSYAIQLLKKSFLEIQIHEYFHWGSRYTATSILIMNPIYFDWYFGYKLIALSMILFFIVASFYLFYTLTENKKTSIVLTSFFCFSYLFMLPDITSAFYWLAGSATYHFANILSLLFLIFLFKANKTGSVYYKILLFILIFLIIGCNEVSMVYLDLLIFMLLIYSLITQRKIHPLYFSLFLWAGILTLFILLAPGNNARADSVNYGDISLMSTILKSIRKSAVILVRYGILTFCINFLVFYNIKNQLVKLNFKFLQFPLYTYMILLLIFLFLGSFPSLWSLNLYSPLRTVNVSFFVMLLFSMIINYKLVTLPSFSNINLSQAFLSITLLLLIFSYIFTVGNKNISELSNNLYWAYSDLTTGKASGYKKEMENQYLYIKNSKEDTIYVQALKSKPRTILKSELSQDPSHYHNQSMAKLFDKKVIIRK